MASKFSMVNTSGMFDTASHIEASDRMQDAMEELKLKHDRQDRLKSQQQQQQKRIEIEQTKRLQRSREAAIANAAIVDDSYIRPHAKEESEVSEEEDEDEEKAAQASDDDDDDALLEGSDQDPELERIRATRLKQLKQQYVETQSLVSKGHGEYHEIVQDEFLKQVTSSALVLIHFYHTDFERCKLMDKHLQRLVKTHLECKFLKMNAEKAPFFVEKLKIRVLPTLVGFQDGIAFPTRLIGFDGLLEEEEEEEGAYGSRLNYRAKASDTFRTATLAKRLVEIGVLKVNEADEDDERW